MTSTAASRISEFKCSQRYKQVKSDLRKFVLCGQEEDLAGLQESVLNQEYHAESSVQVMNTLGYALGLPPIDCEGLSHTQKQKFQTGDMCIFQEKYHETLKKLVGKMSSYRFALVPLAVVPYEGKSFNTILIKVYTRGTIDYYVDMIGRRYESFPQYLESNKLPFSILCYTKNCRNSFDDAGDIQLAFAEVGLTNTAFEKLDNTAALLGVVGTIGACFASGGLAVPFVWASIGSAGYATTRSIANLVDADKHGMSLNPFTDSEARSNWLTISASLLAFSSMRVAKGGRMTKTSIILGGVSAGVNMLAMVDSVLYMANNWPLLSTQEKVRIACAICFRFRVVFSFSNTERIFRERNLQGICEFFKSCLKVAATSSVAFFSKVKGIFENNDGWIANGLKLVKLFLLHNVAVELDEDCINIRFLGYEFNLPYLIRLEQIKMTKFVYMILGIFENFRAAFALMRGLFGDDKIFAVVSKHADDLGGKQADYGNAINKLIEIFNICRRTLDDIVTLSESKLIIGSGHKFTIKSAFNSFVRSGVTKAIPLLKALLDLTKSQADHLNRFREKREENDASVFPWVTAWSISSSEMVAKLRFLLDVDEICIDKSLLITKLDALTGSIEIESILQIDSQLFYGVEPRNRRFLLDPKFLRTCHSTMFRHSGDLKKLWNNTCLLAEPADKSFEKLATLEHVFQIYPSSVESAISFAFEMQCTNFPQFVSLVLFALNVMERLMRMEKLDEVSANNKVFSEMAALKLRYLKCKEKAQELKLAGYCPMDCTDSMQLGEAIKELAKQELLRFGTVENATLHIDENPRLRLESEILKYNRYICTKKFDRDQVESVGIDGGRQKWLIFLENAQLKIVIGVLENIGAYIDTLQFIRAE